MTDARITWHAIPAERLSELAGISIDACVCNMAIWLLDVEAVLAGLRHMLQPADCIDFTIAPSAATRHLRGDLAGALQSLLL